MTISIKTNYQLRKDTVSPKVSYQLILQKSHKIKAGGYETEMKWLSRGAFITGVGLGVTTNYLGLSISTGVFVASYITYASYRNKREAREKGLVEKINQNRQSKQLNRDN